MRRHTHGYLFVGRWINRLSLGPRLGLVCVTTYEQTKSGVFSLLPYIDSPSTSPRPAPSGCFNTSSDAVPAARCCTPDEAREWVELLRDDPDLYLPALRHWWEVTRNVE